MTPTKLDADEMKAAILAERSRLMQGFTIAVYDELPKPDEVKDFKGAWKIGTGSMINRKEKFRFLKAGEYIREGKLFLTYSDINYTYLKIHAANHPGCRNRLSPAQIKIFSQYRAQTPAYCVPYTGEAIYFDLKAFHANILLAFGRDMDYVPGKYIEPIPNNHDYPYWNNKEARNRLHSTAYAGGHILLSSGDNLRDIDLPTYWANPALIAFTHDLSMMIAHFMVKEGGATYANRDGYIVPMAQQHHARKVLDSIGFPYDIKQFGTATIRHYGDYDFSKSDYTNGHESKRKGHTFASHPLPPFDYLGLFELVKDTIHATTNFLQPAHHPESFPA